MDTTKLLEGLTSEERLELLQRLLREEMATREEQTEEPYENQRQHHHRHGPGRGRRQASCCTCCGA